MIEHYYNEEKKHQKELIYHAWHVEAFQRTKKLPKLEDLLKEKKIRKRQTEQEMLNQIKMLNQAFGGDYKKSP